MNITDIRKWLTERCGADVAGDDEVLIVGNRYHIVNCDDDGRFGLYIDVLVDKGHINSVGARASTFAIAKPMIDARVRYFLTENGDRSPVNGPWLNEAGHE
jgi:hypothetical protein